MDICTSLNPCILKEAAQSRPNNIAILSEENQWTYRALDREVDSYCKAGSEPWVISATPTVATIIRIFAALRLGLSVCVLNPRFPMPESLPPLSLGAGIFFYSSGSTGTPKIIFHPIKNLITNATGVNTYLNIHEQDRYQLSLPLHHTAGVGILFRAFLARAAVVISNDSIDIQATLLSLVPTQLHRILKNKNPVHPHLKAVLIGGSAVRQELLEEAKNAGMPVMTTYALTEMGSTVCLSSSTFFQNTLPYRELRIQTDGEIYVRGNTLFRGYWKDDQLSLPIDREGWFATGDVAKKDLQGSWTLLGRKDAMFICGGENLYPEEIERALLNLPGVLDACVVGAADPEWGAKPVAFVNHHDKNFPLETLKDSLQKTLPTIKIPVKILPLDPQHFLGIKPERLLLKQIAEQT